MKKQKNLYKIHYSITKTSKENEETEKDSVENSSSRIIKYVFVAASSMPLAIKKVKLPEDANIIKLEVIHDNIEIV